MYSIRYHEQSLTSFCVQLLLAASKLSICRCHMLQSSNAYQSPRLTQYKVQTTQKVVAKLIPDGGHEDSPMDISGIYLDV